MLQGVGEAAWTMARAGGKSTMTAAIGCAALDGPLAQPDAEVLIVASSHEQGQIVFRHCLRFLAEKIERGAFRVADTVNTSRAHAPEDGRHVAGEGGRIRSDCTGPPRRSRFVTRSPSGQPRGIGEMLSAASDGGRQDPGFSDAVDRDSGRGRAAPFSRSRYGTRTIRRSTRRGSLIRRSSVGRGSGRIPDWDISPICSWRSGARRRRRSGTDRYWLNFAPYVAIWGSRIQRSRCYSIRDFGPNTRARRPCPGR